MNIVIIGGQGFVGQYLVRELSKNSTNSITITSRNTNKSQYINTSQYPNVTTITGFDIFNQNNILQYVQNQDIVFNLAGLVSFKQKDKSLLNNTNHIGALNVLKACEDGKVKKLIHLSSTAALGYSNTIIDEDHVFDWSHNKKCVYSFSKSLANTHYKKSSLNTIVVYPSLILGPGDNNNTLKLIHAIKKNTIPFNPPGKNSTVDVRDLARALVFLMNHKNKHQEYIIAEGSYSFKQINTLIAKQLNVKPPKLTLPHYMLSPLLFLVDILERFSENPTITYENLYLSFKNRTHGSMRLKELGFQFEYSLQKTIEDSIRWSKTE